MKKLRIRYIALLWLLIAGTIDSLAQLTYRTQELKRLTASFPVDESTLHEGYNYLDVRGQQVVIRVKDNVVEHVGFRLFPDDIRNIDKSPVFDFLERYFLQLTYPPVVKTSLMMQRDDHFRFEKGSLATLSQLQPNDGFSYNYDRYRYVASWSRQGRPFLTVSFPVEYELMSGENKIEAEDHLMTDVQNTPIREENDIISEIRNETYISDDFSNRLYFRKGELLCHADHPAESAANMMLTPNTPGNYQLHITQRMYGFKKTDFEVPLKQWISFCLDHGCKLFFGIENIKSQGTIEAVVIAVNKAENYNHVLSVSISPQVIGQKRGTIEAQLYPYVPTHNVMNLFSNVYKKSNKKTFLNK